MRLTLSLPVLLGGLLVVAPAAGQNPILDQGEALGPPNWCDCRMDPDALDPKKADEDGTRFGRITVAPESVGGNVCKDDERQKCRGGAAALAGALEADGDLLEDDGRDLGPSFVRPPGAAITAEAVTTPEGGHYCTEEMIKKGKARGEEVATPCIQRQEMTIREGFPHRFDPKPRGFEYTIRLRMPEKVFDTEKSIRWVINQWKQRKANVKKYTDEFGAEWSASPFLATRYDNGLIYVTVQDEGCRCVVTSVKSDRLMPLPTGKHPTDCSSSDPPPHGGKSCKTTLEVKYFGDPYLQPIAGEWSELKYRIRAGRAKGSLIEILQDGRKVVEVSGPVGYELPRSVVGPKPTDVYFKFGHYRDIIPATEIMDIDWVKVEEMKP